MWNLEQTEQRVLRFRPVILIVVALLLLALHLSLDSQRLAANMAPAPAFVMEQGR